MRGARDWRSFWAKETTSLQRWKTEGEFARMAREVLFHLSPPPAGGTLLDFATGAGELLVHLAPSFTRIIGVDASASVLRSARSRLLERGLLGRVQLVRADDLSVFPALDLRCERILASGVAQYLDPTRLERLLTGARACLRPGGRLLLFDVPDPRLLELWALGAFRWPRLSLLRAARARLRRSLDRLQGRVRGLEHELGQAYLPDDLLAMAQRIGYQAESAWAMHSEYRYHVVLSVPV